MESVKNLKFYYFVDTPTNRKIVDTNWGFKTKQDKEGNVVRFKGRWVVKGYM